MTDGSFHPGGKLIIEADSIVNFNRRFYLGVTGTVDLAPGARLNVGSDFYWRKDGVYSVGAIGDEIGLITVSGKAYIEEGAVVAIASNLIDAKGKVIFTANTGYEDDTLPVSAFNKIEKSGNSLIIGDVGSSGAVDNISNSGSSGVGPSVNTGAASGLLDRVITSTSTPPALKEALSNYLTAALELAQAGSQYADIALRQLIGEEGLASVNVVTDTISVLNTALGSRFDAIHHNSFAPSAGYQDKLNRLWVSGFGTWARQKNTNGLYGYDYDVGGVLIGYDRELAAAPGLTLGLDLGFSSGKLKNNDRLSSMKVKTISIGAYGSYMLSNGVFFDADLGFGFSHNEFSSNQVVGGRKTGNFHSRSFQLGFDFGYRADISGNFSLTPQAGLNYVHVKQKAWTERIASDPNSLVVANWFGDAKIDYLEIPVSLKLQGAIETSGGILVKPELKVGAVFVADKPNHDIRVGFVGSGESALIRGVDSGKSRFVAGAGISIQANDYLDIFASYDFETRSSYKSHSARLGIGISF
jgi:outer membrane autotransporter protein